LFYLTKNRQVFIWRSFRNKPADGWLWCYMEGNDAAMENPIVAWFRRGGEKWIDGRIGREICAFSQTMTAQLMPRYGKET
jgi:hypothetical protein